MVCTLFLPFMQFDFFWPILLCTYFYFYFSIIANFSCLLFAFGFHWLCKFTCIRFSVARFRNGIDND